MCQLAILWYLNSLVVVGSVTRPHATRTGSYGMFATDLCQGKVPKNITGSVSNPMAA